MTTKNYNVVPYQIDETNILQVTQVQDDVWLTQKQMAQLFGVDKSRISRHLQNIFEENELVKNSVVAFFAQTSNDGKQYNVAHYNLDAIISVGYRVNSKRGIMFRQWATKIIKERIKQEYQKRKEANEQRTKRIATAKKEDIAQIKNLLLEKEITQQQIASDLGVHYVTVHNIIYGKTHNPSILNYIKEILGINEENKLFSKSVTLLKDTFNGDKTAFKKLTDLISSVADVHDFNDGVENV
ncbi:virulence RhuM family protein [bacterium]|nr:virulence RhuM family protein [bacterium]